MVENVSTLLQTIKTEDNADRDTRNTFPLPGFHHTAKSYEREVSEEYATFHADVPITWGCDQMGILQTLMCLCTPAYTSKWYHA